MDSNCPRRAFLRKAAGLAAVLVTAPFLVNSIEQSDSSKGSLSDRLLTPGINPAFRIYCFRDGSIELSASRKSEAGISHIYNPGLEVDVLLLIALNKPINDNLSEIAKRHSISESTCKGRADKMMNEFKSKELICFGDSMETETSYA